MNEITRFDPNGPESDTEKTAEPLPQSIEAEQRPESQNIDD